MKSFLLFIFLLSSFQENLSAADVDTVSIYSTKMAKSFNCVVIKPEEYSAKHKAYETVYLLHGHGGNYKNWLAKVPELKLCATKYQLILVCPEGAKAGWYFDSPLVDSMQFESYISTELPAYIDGHYNTVKNRKGRAITGLSMGGHGGLYLGLRHADKFGACGSMSGAFLIPMITDKFYGIDKLLGDTNNKQNYYEHSVIYQLEHYPKDSVAIIFDCGTEDFIYGMSKALHEKMLQLKIPHDYIERPGKHDWPYWANAVQYQLLYFRNYFDRNK